MADIINNPGDNRGGSGGLIALILGIVLLILLVLLFFPALFDRDNDTDTQLEDTNPTGTENVIIPPPTVNNTTINSTSTINLGATTTDEDAE